MSVSDSSRISRTWIGKHWFVCPYLEYPVFFWSVQRHTLRRSHHVDLCCVTAHHKVSSSIEGEQEAYAAAAGNGEVITLPDLRWDPLLACQLGSAQRPGEYKLNRTKLGHCESSHAPK